LGFAYAGFASLIDLKPFVEKTVPRDTISKSGNRLIGKVHFFHLGEENLRLESKEFDTEMRSPLSSFSYKKPLVEGDVFKPNEEWEKKQRKDYYPLIIVEDAYHGPNHWHRSDDALFYAVEIDDEWQTRYFPKENIPEATWNEALLLLK
jgi:hypothetical protein